METSWPSAILRRAAAVACSFEMFGAPWVRSFDLRFPASATLLVAEELSKTATRSHVRSGGFGDEVSNDLAVFWGVEGLVLHRERVVEQAWEGVQEVQVDRALGTAQGVLRQGG